MRNKAAPWWRFDWYPWPLNLVVWEISAIVILLTFAIVVLPTLGLCRVFRKTPPKWMQMERSP